MGAIQVPFNCWSRTTIGDYSLFAQGPTLQKVRNFRPGRGSVWEEEERRFLLDRSSQFEAAAELPSCRT
jgi:hypothetical protein